MHDESSALAFVNSFYYSLRFTLGSVPRSHAFDSDPLGNLNFRAQFVLDSNARYATSAPTLYYACLAHIFAMLVTARKGGVQAHVENTFAQSARNWLCHVRSKKRHDRGVD